MFASKDIFLTAPSGGYNIARSVRLRRSATGNFSRTPASASNRQTWTWSGWVKRGDLTNENVIFGSRPSAGTYTQFSFRNSGSSAPFCLLVEDNVTGNMLVTTQVFRDPSAWYHIVVAMDTTQATSSNRAKLYVNGVQVTSFTTANYPAQNANLQINNTTIHNLGRDNVDSASNFDGYMTEVNFVDGQQLTPSSFGETDSITGVWKPKAYSGTYGTNGFELNFSDNSNNTAATIGKDYSGNGNNWTPNNISVTAGTTYDSMVDSPTVGATSSNYCVMNPLDFKGSNAPTLANANLRINGVSTAAWRASASTIAFSSQKIYCEITLNGAGLTSGGSRTFGIIGTSTNIGASGVGFASNTGWGIAATTLTNDGAWTNGSKTTLTGISTASGTVYQIAVNGTLGSGSNKIWFGQNGTWFNSGDPSAGTSAIFSNLPSDMQFIAAILTDSGYDLDVNFGQRPFSYTPPTGFVALNTYNLPASTITNGAAYMAATTYTGNGTTTGNTQTISNAVNGASFQPDFVWLKSRSNGTYFHLLLDSVRGVNKTIYSNDTGAEDSVSNVFNSFNSNGFTVAYNSSYGQVVSNANTVTYVGWQWKAGGTAVSNTDGTITSTVSANTTAGFSVVTFTAPASGNFSAGHGLGVTPGMVITKVRGRATSWITWHNRLNSGSPGTTYYIELNTTGGQSTFANVWGSTGVTSSVIGMGVNASCAASDTIVAYCFAAVAGYSAFGSYTGNGSTDGTFVYLGFRPKFVLFRSTSASRYWVIRDTSRDTFNTSTSDLYPNTTDSTGAGADIDILSNGFKLRATSATFNGSGETYIYAAFAENPFKNALAR